MGHPAEKPSRIAYADYLRLEQDTARKHEWFEGQVFAMAGGTIEHGQLAMQVGAELLRLGAGCGCRVFSSDVKVRVLATGLATYPDVSMVCGAIERDPDDANAVTNPTVLVEVLSDGTEAYDRGDKFEQYRHIPSLKDYVMVSQRTAHIEVYSRGEHGRWVLTEAGAGSKVTLTALEGAIEVDRVYAGVELPAAARSPAMLPER